MPNKPIQPVSIVSPGFFGINTQDSGVTLDLSFTLEADNAVIDKSGRMAARKGWEYQTTAGGYKFHGKLELWNPQTTFPHWNAEAYYASSGNNIVNTKTHGWINNDGGGDIDGFQLKPSTGNFDDGQIAMYGFKRT